MKQQLAQLMVAIAIGAVTLPAAAQQGVTKYVRYSHQNVIAYGILEGETIRELKGNLFAGATPTGRTVKLADARLLAPCQPSKVIAVGLNYKSHLGERPAATYPGLFAKLPTSIVGPDDAIVATDDAKNLHFEGELVVVMGRRAKNVSVADAPSYVFGVTAGNDVSERDWQKSDLQWFRAKASDTFGPLGPVIVNGPELRRPAAANARERRGPAVTAHEGSDLRRPRDRQLHQPFRDARTR